MKIGSVSALLGALKKAKKVGNPIVWYRGHADSSWPLISGYHRLKQPPPESVLLNRFRQNANLLLVQQPKDTFEWLFLMQHYGVPTRLLDWSESPLVALYFAVTSLEKKDGAIWVLDPVRLNQTTKARPEDYKFVPAFDDELVKGYDTHSVESSPDLGIEPIAVMATRNNPRIQAQLGVFTISHKAPRRLEDISDGTHVRNFVIPASAKQKIREELEILAMGTFQIFPELPGVGEIIRKGVLR